MIEIKVYENKLKNQWDEFLHLSRISTFLLKRDFMEYHADRFIDLSFLIYRKGKLVGLIPGNIKEETWFSHQGLTYGGIVSSKKITMLETITVFDLLNDFLRDNGVVTVVYKPIPYIYQRYPCQEDLYALFRLNAQKTTVNIASVVDMKNKIPFSNSRKSGVKKALKNSVNIIESDDYISFWKILEENLKIHFDEKPVHTLSEITRLSKLFPQNIKLHCAILDNSILAGVVLFITENVVHVQYISTNKNGKNYGALDLIFDKLISQEYKNYKYFDFGTSNENQGKYLNEGLIFQKEGFGGRAVVYETYRYTIN